MNTVSFSLLFSFCATLAAYLMGSIPFAVIVSRAFRLDDPRSYGSKNPGATNVLRSGNKLAALLTLLGDAAKGWLAVYLIQHLGPQLSTLIPSLNSAQLVSPTDLIALVAFAVFFGHLYPIFLGFKGGKGVATAAGVLIGLSPWLGLGVLLVWICMAAIFRYSSLAALAAAAVAPLFCALIFGVDSRTLAALCIGILIFIRHRENIRKLRAGTEGKIGQKKTVTV